MRAVIIGAVTLSAIALGACTPSRPSAKVAMQLAKDAAPLMSLCPEPQGIDPSRWPLSLTTAGVDSAYIGHGGLYIETDRDYVQESGVFVPYDAKSFVADPITGEDPVYLKVADGVFTYYIAG